jgi:bacteriocin biosynthesis cyclodehydratase domain-containing protein
MNKADDRKFRALPAEIIKIEGGILVRRDCTLLRVHGEGVEAILKLIFGRAGLEAATQPELREAVAQGFPELDPPRIDRLIEYLERARILVDAASHSPADESEGPLELFFWNYDAAWKKSVRSLAQHRIGLLGINLITRRLASALRDAGFKEFEIFDKEDLRNPRLFVSDRLNSDQWPEPVGSPISEVEWKDRRTDISCLVAACEFGGQQLLRRVNADAVEAKIPFLPIILHDHVGQIGPFVIPRETACLECVRARQNAAMSEPALQRAVEHRSDVGILVTGYHPSMLSILGDIAALELTKFFSPSLPYRRIGNLIEVDLLKPSIVVRKVLKVPRCKVCSNVQRVSSTGPDRNNFQPEPRRES